MSTKRNGTVDQIRSRLPLQSETLVHRRAVRAYNQATGRPEHMRVVSGPSDQAAWQAALAGAILGYRLAA